MNIAPPIEHTRLHAAITEKDIDDLIREAIEYKFPGISVPPNELIHDSQTKVKAIIETAFLSEAEIGDAGGICANPGVDYVKTSTGLAPEGAKEEHIRLMLASLPRTEGIKASGGIKTYEHAVTLLNAGADRIGTSPPGVSIIAQSINKS